VRPLPPTPLVSIVTPSYNTGRFIEETLRSVQEQDYPRIEHIVLDSGSTDQTPEILDRYPAVRVITHPGGVSEKVNHGFSIATGEILAWINADDFYLPGAVSKAVTALQEHPDAGLVYCNYLHVDEESVEIDRERSKQAGFRELIEERNYIPHQTAFFRREALEQVGGEVNVRYPLVQDWDLWIRISKEFPILHVDDWWAAFRVSRGQRSDVHKYAFWSQGRKMTREHGARFFSPLVWDYWRGKVSRAGRMLARGDLGTFASKLRDFARGFGRTRSD
jgi:glycosyltransferase involved in cell wall biosynthesis